MAMTILDELKRYYFLAKGGTEESPIQFRRNASGYFRHLTRKLPTESTDDDITYCQSHTLEEFLELFYSLFNLETLIMIEKK